MDDLRLGAIGRLDWYAGQPKDAPKKRSRHTHVEEPSEEPVDEVVLSSPPEEDGPPAES